MTSAWLETSLRLSAIEQAWKEQTRGTVASDLSVKQAYILSSLFERDGQKPSELALQVGCAATSFTPVLDDLENDGLIQRSPNKTDRRAVDIHLTKKGKSYEVVICEALKAVEKAF